MQNFHRITANIDLLPNMTWRFADFQQVLTHDGAGLITGRLSSQSATSDYRATQKPKRKRAGRIPVNPVDVTTGRPKRGRPSKAVLSNGNEAHQG